MVQKDRNLSKERIGRRNEEGSRMTSGENNTQTERREEMRSSGSIGNDTPRRMDEKCGGRSEDRGGNHHPMDQEVNKK